MRKTMLSAMLCGMAMIGFGQTLPTNVDFESDLINGTGNYTYNGSGTYVPSSESVINYTGNLSTNPPNLTFGDVNNDYFNAAYGVKFLNRKDNGDIVHAVMSKRNTVSGPNINSGFQSHTCSISYDYVCNSTMINGKGQGDWFLTNAKNSGSSGEPPVLIIQYDADVQPCNVASGYLYDIDGGSSVGWEVFRVRLYSIANTTVPDNTIYLSSFKKGSSLDISANYSMGGYIPTTFYNQNGTNLEAGDASSTYFEIASLGGQYIDRIEIDYVGTPNKPTGIAFDNFYYCSSLASSECQPIPNVLPQVNGCGVKFFNSTYSPGGSYVIGQEWNFGDGTSSKEKEPFHSYGSPGTYTVLFTAFSFNGDYCCKVEKEYIVTVEECKDCRDQSIDIGASVVNDCDDCTKNLRANISVQNSEVLGYFWEIGNGGGTKTGERITYTFSGPTNVCLTTVFQDPNSEEMNCCKVTTCRTIDCGKEPVDPDDNHTDDPNHGGPVSPKPVKNNFENNLSGFENLTIFPNPAKDELNINLISPNEFIGRISLVDISGLKSMLKNKIKIMEGQNSFRVSVDRFKPGVYQLLIEGEGTFKSSTVIIE